MPTPDVTEKSTICQFVEKVTKLSAEKFSSATLRVYVYNCNNCNTGVKFSRVHAILLFF